MWTNAAAELRTALFDGPKDKLRFSKQIIGNQNGANVQFKTFEFRRTTDFTSADEPLGVYVDGELVDVAEDFPDNGAFNLKDAPAQDQEVRASYYVQFFTDDDLTQFLSQASRWLNSNPDFTLVDPGLQPSVLKYAMGEACANLATRFINHLSETYRLEDVPDKDQKEFVIGLQDGAIKLKDEALKIRTEFYSTRQGQALQPLFSSISGNVQRVVPNR